MCRSKRFKHSAVSWHYVFCGAEHGFILLARNHATGYKCNIMQHTQKKQKQECNIYITSSTVTTHPTQRAVTSLPNLEQCLAKSWRVCSRARQVFPSLPWSVCKLFVVFLGWTMKKTYKTLWNKDALMMHIMHVRDFLDFSFFLSLQETVLSTLRNPDKSISISVKKLYGMITTWQRCP